MEMLDLILLLVWQEESLDCGIAKAGVREVQWSEGERLQSPYCRSGLDLGQCLNVVDEVLWMAIGGATHCTGL